MRVLHVLCDLNNGGAERIVAALCAGRPGAEVVTVQDGGELGPLFAAQGTRTRSAGRPRRSIGAAALSRLSRWARDFELVHTHLWVADVYGAAAAALAGVPCVSTEHNVAEAEARWRVRARILAARGQVRVTAVSGAVARSWSEAGLPQRKIEVIPNGIDLARYQKPWQGLGSRRVLAIGRPVPQKGFDVLQSAVRGWSDVAVEIAGHAGPVHDIPDRLSVAAVLVVPSRWEGFGLVAAEGLAAGVPVVASDLPALREVIGEAGLLVPPGDEVGLRDAIRRVVDDPALSRRLSEAGRDRARSFSVDRMRDGYEALYERVLAEHGSPLSP